MPCRKKRGRENFLFVKRRIFTVLRFGGVKKQCFLKSFLFFNRQTVDFNVDN